MIGTRLWFGFSFDIDRATCCTVSGMEVNIGLTLFSLNELAMDMHAYISLEDK